MIRPPEPRWSVDQVGSAARCVRSRLNGTPGPVDATLRDCAERIWAWGESWSRTGEDYKRRHCQRAVAELRDWFEAADTDRVPAYERRLIRAALHVGDLIATSSGERGI